MVLRGFDEQYFSSSLDLGLPLGCSKDFHSSGQRMPEGTFRERHCRFLVSSDWFLIGTIIGIWVLMLKGCGGTESFAILIAGIITLDVRVGMLESRLGLKVCLNLWTVLKLLSCPGNGCLGAASLCLPPIGTDVAEITAVPLVAASWPRKPDAWRTLAIGVQGCAGLLLC
jgi:hypothetical protein